MTDQEFIDKVYAQFVTTGAWPPVNRLQVQLRQVGNVRLLAARIGRDNVVCEDGQDGVCFLTLRGMARCLSAAVDIAHFLGALRYLARVYIGRGRVQVNSEDMSRDIGLDAAATARLRDMLWHNAGIMSGGGYTPGAVGFTFVPSDNIYAFENVQSLDDYFASLETVGAQAREASLLQWQDTPAGARSNPAADAVDLRSMGVPNSLPLHHAQLRIVAERDLAELQQVVAVQAWKAATVLAGSCLEAALTDLWFRNEERAKQLWPNKWPSSVGLAELADAAVRAGFITTVHRDLVSAIRRARNIVHPYRASQEQVASPELVSVLLATLRLLAKELSTDAA